MSEQTEPAAGQSKDRYTEVMLVPLPGVFESMRKRLLAVLLLAVVASLAARLAMGQCVLGALDEDIRSSEIILIGTVVAGDQVEVPRVGGASEVVVEITTHYRLNDVRYLKGDGPSDSLTLVQPMGFHEPQFTVGERYVIFVGTGGRGNRYAYECRTPYNVRADSTKGEPIIYKRMAPLIEFTDSTMVWGVRPNMEPKTGQMELTHGIFLRRDNGARVTESAFIATMNRRVRRVAEDAK